MALFTLLCELKREFNTYHKRFGGIFELDEIAYENVCIGNNRRRSNDR